MNVGLLKRHAPHEEQEVLDKLPETKRAPPKDPYQGIRCPKCCWRPVASSRWMCRKPCFHVWNTFDTHGRCPACRYQWRDTQCLGCGKMSPHEDWYEKPRGEDA